MECPVCHGKTVWFGGGYPYTLVYICPKLGNTELDHKTDAQIKDAILEMQIKGLENIGISQN